jgi:hypothetical protein
LGDDVADPEALFRADSIQLVAGVVKVTNVLLSSTVRVNIFNQASAEIRPWRTKVGFPIYWVGFDSNVELL